MRTSHFDFRSGLRVREKIIKKLILEVQEIMHPLQGRTATEKEFSMLEQMMECYMQLELLPV